MTPSEEPFPPLADEDQGRDLTEPFVMVPMWLVNARVSSRAMHLYVVIRSFMRGPEWTAFPSRQVLAAKVGLRKESAVDPYLAELVRVGALRIEKRVVKGLRSSHRYEIPRSRLTLSPPGDSVIPSKGQPVIPPRGQEVDEPLDNPPLPPRKRGGGCDRHRRPRAGCPECESPDRPPLPPWCGSCDSPTTRVVPVERGRDGEPVKWGRCPTCHPSATG